MALSKLWMPQKYEIPWCGDNLSRSIQPNSISHNKFIVCDEILSGGYWNNNSDIGTFSFGEFTEETNAWKIKTLNVGVKNNCDDGIIQFIHNVSVYNSKSQILYLLDTFGNLWWIDFINDAVNCFRLIHHYPKLVNGYIELVNGKIVFIPRRKKCKHAACIIDFANSQMFVHEKFILPHQYADKFDIIPEKFILPDSYADKFDIIRLNHFKGLIC